MTQFEPQAPPDRTGKPHRVRTIVLLVLGVLAASAGVSWSVGAHYAAVPADQTIPGVVTKTAAPQAVSTIVPPPPPATAKPHPPAPQPGVVTHQTRDSKYLALLHDQYPDTEGVNDSTWIGLAQSACGVLNAGGTKADIMLELLDQYDEDTSPVIAYAVGAGVQAYCPKYAHLFLGTTS